MKNNIFWLHWKYIENKKRIINIAFLTLPLLLGGTIVIVFKLNFQRPLTNIIPELITANSIFIGFLYSVLTTFRATDVSERMRLKIVDDGVSRLDTYIYSIAWAIVTNFLSIILTLILSFWWNLIFLCITITIFLNSLYYTFNLIKESLYIYKN